MGFNSWFFEKIFSRKEVERKAIGYLEGWISIIGNIGLFIFKFLSGIYLNSISLIADAFHSLSDVLTSIIVILGFKLAEKPADRKHPFGHGRIEQIATLIIAFMLLIISYNLGKSSIERVIDPQKVSFNVPIVILMFLSALFKEWMARFSKFLGERINSSTLIADAWHHRSDALATVLVAMGLIGINFGIYRIDGIMGLIVTLLLLWVGIDLIKNSSSFLIGEAPNQDIINKIRNILFSIPEVSDYHDVSVHDYQSNKIITLHIVVEDNISAKDAHRIALKVQDLIKEGIQGAQAIVHIDPKGERED